MSRKNHKMVDGKLLQTDKKYSNLKMKQKENINLWIGEKERSLAISQIQIEPLEVELSVCKVADYSKVDMNAEFCFIGKTDAENSLVCPSSVVPENVIERDEGCRARRASVAPIMKMLIYPLKF